MIPPRRAFPLVLLVTALVLQTTKAFLQGLPRASPIPATKGSPGLFTRKALILKPTLLVTTSAEGLTKEKEDAFLIEASKAVASGLGKPESYVMVSLTKANMRFAGHPAPCAFLHLASIGAIGSSTNPAVSKSLCELVEKHMGIPANRVYIQFYDSPAANFGFNEATFG